MDFSIPKNEQIRTINKEELTLEAKIGCGSFGVIYSGTWKGRACAIKKVHLEAPISLNVLCALNEIQVQAKLRHPNIVELFGVSYHPGCDLEPAYYCIVMQLVRGNPLDIHIDWLWSHKNESIPLHLSMKERIRWARQASGAISYLHSQGFVHGDITASNFIVEEKTNKLFLCDFGTTQYIGRPGHGKHSIGESAYTQFKFVGTLTYLAPECFQEKNSGQHFISTKSDIWSLGLVLLELFSESQIFNSPKGIINFKCGISDLPIKIGLEKIENLTLKRILSEMLCYDPIRRPPAADLYDEFLSLS